MAAAEVGQVDCIRILVKELGCNKDAQSKVCTYVSASLNARIIHICRALCIHVCMYVLSLAY